MAARSGVAQRPLLLLLVMLLAVMSVSVHGWAAHTATPTIEKAQGDTALLDCTWDADAPAGPLDVEWFRHSLSNNVYVATFSGGAPLIYGDFQTRVRFARNLTQRDASVAVAALRPGDEGSYVCKVKIAGVISEAGVTLTVLVKPSQPSCVVSGPVEPGRDLTLECGSSEGTSPISYEWKKMSEGASNSPPPLLTTTGGIVSIRNASASNSGLYQCNATNRVGWQSCVVLLTVAPPTSNAGVVAGVIIGVLLIIAVVGFLVWFLLRRRKEKPSADRDYHNDIRMDDSPPASLSRPPTRAANDLPSARTSIGSATPSNGLLALRAGAPQGGGSRGDSAAPGGPPYGGRQAFPSVREEGSELSGGSGGGGGGGGGLYESIPNDDRDASSDDDLPPSHSPEPPRPKEGVVYSELMLRPGGSAGGGAVRGVPRFTEYASVRGFRDNSAV